MIFVANPPLLSTMISEVGNEMTQRNEFAPRASHRIVLPWRKQKRAPVVNVCYITTTCA